MNNTTNTVNETEIESDDDKKLRLEGFVHGTVHEARYSNEPEEIYDDFYRALGDLPRDERRTALEILFFYN